MTKEITPKRYIFNHDNLKDFVETKRALDLEALEIHNLIGCIPIQCANSFVISYADQTVTVDIYYGGTKVRTDSFPLRFLSMSNNDILKEINA